MLCMPRKSRIMFLSLFLYRMSFLSFHVNLCVGVALLTSGPEELDSNPSINLNMSPRVADPPPPTKKNQDFFTYNYFSSSIFNYSNLIHLTPRVTDPGSY